MVLSYLGMAEASPVQVFDGVLTWQVGGGAGEDQ